MGHFYSPKQRGGAETAVSSKSSAGLLSLERSRIVDAAQPTFKRTTDKTLNEGLMSRSTNYGKNKRIYAPQAPAEMETNERER